MHALTQCKKASITGIEKIMKTDRNELMRVIERVELKTTGWSVMIVEISADQARQILETRNKINRRLRPSHMKWLKQAMLRGEFMLTPEAMIFDQDGNVMSAQHRLRALVEAGGSQKFMCVGGVSRDIYKVIDQGAKRNMSDAFETDSRVQQPITYIAKLYYGHGTPSIGQVERVKDVFVEHAINLIDACGQQKKVFSSAPVKAAALIRMAIGDDQDFILSQYRVLVHQDYDAMTPYMKSFNRQVASGDVGAHKSLDLLVRAYRVFDKERSDMSRVTVKEMYDLDEIRDYLRMVIGE